MTYQVKILTAAPSAYSYHPFHEFRFSEMDESSKFSRSLEWMDGDMDTPPEMDHFLWGDIDDVQLINSRNIDKWVCITVECDDLDRLAYLVEYQMDRIGSGFYVRYETRPRCV